MATHSEKYTTIPQVTSANNELEEKLRERVEAAIRFTIAIVTNRRTRWELNVEFSDLMRDVSYTVLKKVAIQEFAKLNSHNQVSFSVNHIRNNSECDDCEDEDETIFTLHILYNPITHAALVRQAKEKEVVDLCKPQEDKNAKNREAAIKFIAAEINETKDNVEKAIEKAVEKAAEMDEAEERRAMKAKAFEERRALAIEEREARRKAFEERRAKAIEEGEARRKRIEERQARRREIEKLEAEDRAASHRAAEARRAKIQESNARIAEEREARAKELEKKLADRKVKKEALEKKLIEDVHAVALKAVQNGNGGWTICADAIPNRTGHAIVARKYIIATTNHDLGVLVGIDCGKGDGVSIRDPTKAEVHEAMDLHLTIPEDFKALLSDEE